MNEQKHSIQIRDLNVGYTTGKGQLEVLKNINLVLKSKKFVCLLGKNGAGKSTLLRTLTNVQPPLKGTIDIANHPISALNTLEMSKLISVVFTEKIPASNLKVYELVALGRQPYTNWLGKLTVQDREIINTAFEMTNTSHLKTANYYELSDGQLQKILIARALAQNTPVIVLDEPTSHLDIEQTVETFSLLKKMARELGKTIIISSHEINLALKMADELWIIQDDQLHCGNLEYHMEKNHLSSLFDTDLLHFNKTLKQFTTKDL